MCSRLEISVEGAVFLKFELSNEGAMCSNFKLIADSMLSSKLELSTKVAMCLKLNQVEHRMRDIFKYTF